VAGPAGIANDPCQGKNPPYGASINYYLKAEPKDEVVIAILDATGKPVRTLKTEPKSEGEESGAEDERERDKPFSVPKKAGLNRVWWDLRYDRTTEIKLWTPTVDHAHATVGPQGWRRFPQGRFRSGPLVEPGEYTVKLAVGKQEFTEKLIVRKDPNTAGTETDIREQTKLLLGIHEMTNTAAGMINQTERIRKQLRDLGALLEGSAEAEAIVKAARDLDQKLADFEDFFFPVRLTGSGDELRWPDKFYAKLGFLASSIAEADHLPTAQQREVYDLFMKQLGEEKAKLGKLIDEDLGSINNMLLEKKVPHIIYKFDRSSLLSR